MNPVSRYTFRILGLPARPSMIYLKTTRRKPMVGVEVGTSQGAHAKNILSRIPKIKRLYLVDPYRYSEDRDDQHRVGGDYDENKKMAFNKLAPFKDRTVFIYEPFNSDLIPEKVDFIYIDGDHSTDAVMSDIQESLKIIKDNGIIAGHDIHYKSVKKGVRTMFGKNYTSFGLDWWINLSSVPKIKLEDT